jgi:branched-chain amino acid aminotransferase
MPRIIEGTRQEGRIIAIMSERVNVNGALTDAAGASVSPLDRGFLYGHSVYETVRTYGGRLFRLAAHLDRLRRSAERLDIPFRNAPVDIEREVLRTLSAAGSGESAIRIILTRGVGPVGYDPGPAGPPTCVIHVRPLAPVPAAHQREGIDIAVVHVTRNAATALDPSIKSSNLLNNFLAWREADQMGAFEAILVNVEGRLTEGASSNLFLIREGGLVTPPPGDGILIGITREVVLSLARGAGLSVAETSLEPDDLRRADEAFITSTLKGILPVRRCDGWPIREGRPGPVTRRLIDLFERLVQEETNTGSAPGSMRR